MNKTSEFDQLHQHPSSMLYILCEQVTLVLATTTPPYRRGTVTGVEPIGTIGGA